MSRKPAYSPVKQPVQQSVQVLPLLALKHGPSQLHAAALEACVLRYATGFRNRSGTLQIPAASDDAKPLDVINPFRHATEEGTIEAMTKVAKATGVDVRRAKTQVSIRKGVQSVADQDFHEYVLLPGNYETIKQAVDAGRIVDVRYGSSQEDGNAGGVQLADTVVVPAKGKGPIWVVCDAMHLSCIERKAGDVVTATIKPLRAPYADLLEWLQAASTEYKRQAESEVELLTRLKSSIKRSATNALGGFTGLWAQDTSIDREMIAAYRRQKQHEEEMRELERQRQAKNNPSQAPPPPVDEEPKLEEPKLEVHAMRIKERQDQLANSGKALAHDLFHEWPVQGFNGWWQYTKSLSLGLVSLEGAPHLGVPAASELSRAVLAKYLRAKKNCFESVDTVMRRIMMDRDLNDAETLEMQNLVLRRRQLAIQGATYYYRMRDGKARLHVILEQPLNGRRQLMIDMQETGDCPFVVLVLDTGFQPTAQDEAEAEAQFKLTGQAAGKLENQLEQDMTVRNLVAEQAAADGAFWRARARARQTAAMVVALQEVDGVKQGVLEQAINSFGAGTLERYTEMAMCLSERHDLFDYKATQAAGKGKGEAIVKIVAFLLSMCIDGQSPYAGSFTRGAEAVMHKLNLTHAQFETGLSVVMAAKAGAFFAEGLLEAQAEGFSLETIVRGLSYSFTWTYVSEEGALEFFGTVLADNVNPLTAVMPFYGALKFGNTMLTHAKHGFDQVKEIKNAEAATVVPINKPTTLKLFREACHALQCVHVASWVDALDAGEKLLARPNPTYAGHTFESAPLGVPVAQPEGVIVGEPVPGSPNAQWQEAVRSVSIAESIPLMDGIKDTKLVVWSPYDETIHDVTYACYDATTRLMRLRRDGFDDVRLAVFVDPADEAAWERVLKAAQTVAELKQLKRGACSGVPVAKVVVQDGRLTMFTTARPKDVVASKPVPGSPSAQWQNATRRLSAPKLVPIGPAKGSLLSLFVPVETYDNKLGEPKLTPGEVQRAVLHLAGKGVRTISNVGGSSRLSAVVRSALVALMLRMFELKQCSDESLDPLIRKLVLNQDGLPDFKATLQRVQARNNRLELANPERIF